MFIYNSWCIRIRFWFLPLNGSFFLHTGNHWEKWKKLAYSGTTGENPSDKILWHGGYGITEDKIQVFIRCRTWKLFSLIFWQTLTNSYVTVGTALTKRKKPKDKSTPALCSKAGGHQTVKLGNQPLKSVTCFWIKLIKP